MFAFVCSFALRLESAPEIGRPTAEDGYEPPGRLVLISCTCLSQLLHTLGGVGVAQAVHVILRELDSGRRTSSAGELGSLTSFIVWSGVPREIRSRRSLIRGHVIIYVNQILAAGLPRQGSCARACFSCAFCRASRVYIGTRAPLF